MITREEFASDQYRKRMAKSQIPTRFWGKRIDTLNLSLAVEQVGEYIDHLGEHRSAGRGLLLLGDPGRGKTTLACVTGLHAFDNKMSAFYTTLADYKTLLTKEIGLQSAMSAVRGFEAEELFDEWDYTRRVIERIQQNVVFLIVDDVGKEYTTDSKYVESAFDQLLRSRFDRGLPTILTTNKPVPEWVTYSESMPSFLNEACVQVVVGGQDRRKRH